MSINSVLSSLSLSLSTHIHILIALKEGKGKRAPAIRAGVFVIRTPFSQLIRWCHCQYVTNHKYGASHYGPNLITLFTGNCQVETLSSSDIIIIKRNETILLFLLPQQTRQTDYEQSLIFFTARSLRQTMISFVWIHKTFYLATSAWWSQRTEHWPAWDTNNESTGELQNNCQNAQRIVFTKAWSALSLQTI